MTDFNKSFGNLRQEMRSKVFVTEELNNRLAQGIKNKRRSTPRKSPLLKTALAASLITLTVSSSLLLIPIKGTTGEVTNGWHYVTEGAYKLLAGWLAPEETNSKKEIGWINLNTYFMDTRGTETKTLTYSDIFAAPESGKVEMQVEVGTRKGKNVIFTQAPVTPEMLIPSPRLDKYAFISRGGGNIWIIDSNSLKLTQLVPDKIGNYDRKALIEKNHIPGADTYQPNLYWAMDPKWSPDGKYIAYTSNRALLYDSPKGTISIGMEVWLADVKTGENTLIYQDPDRALHLLGWDNQGRVLVRTAKNKAGGILAVDSSTQQAEMLLEGNIMIDRVSPDGSKAVFFKVNSEQTVETANPYVIELDSKKEIALPTANPEVYNTEMLFSPDGNKLFAVRQDMQGNQKIVILNTKNPNVTENFDPPKGETIYLNMCTWIANNEILVITSPKVSPLQYNTWVLSVK